MPMVASSDVKKGAIDLQLDAPPCILTRLIDEEMDVMTMAGDLTSIMEIDKCICTRVDKLLRISDRQTNWKWA